MRTSNLQILLWEVVSRRRPDLVDRVALSRVLPLCDEDRELLRKIIVDELTATGIDPDGTINDRGIALDEVIGYLGNL